MTADWLELDPGRVEPSVERIVVAASCDGGTFGEVADLYMQAVSAATGARLVLYAVEGATTETAILLGEFYRGNGGWKFRAVGQGYASGLPGLAADFGFTVPEDAPAPPLPHRLPPAPPLPETGGGTSSSRPSGPTAEATTCSAGRNAGAAPHRWPRGPGCWWSKPAEAGRSSPERPAAGASGAAVVEGVAGARTLPPAEGPRAAPPRPLP